MESTVLSIGALFIVSYLYLGNSFPVCCCAEQGKSPAPHNASGEALKVETRAKLQLSGRRG